MFRTRPLANWSTATWSISPGKSSPLTSGTNFRPRSNLAAKRGCRCASERASSEHSTWRRRLAQCDVASAPVHLGLVELKKAAQRPPAQIVEPNRERRRGVAMSNSDDEDKADWGNNSAPVAPYKVGYKKPPLHTQFKPGQSHAGNGVSFLRDVARRGGSAIDRMLAMHAQAVIFTLPHNRGKGANL